MSDGQKSAVEIARIAVDGRKIEAIREVRVNGVSSTCQDYFVGDSYRSHFDTIYIRPSELGLYDAKILVESWMDSVANNKNVEYDGESTLARLRSPEVQARVTASRVTQSELNTRQVETDLETERNAARKTEQRLGKALRQVEGLQDKVLDRNARLQLLAFEKTVLHERVRVLEKLIVDRALADARFARVREDDFGWQG